MKMKLSDNFKLAILWLLSFGIIAIILFLMCFSSNAEEPVVFDNTLPFYFNSIDNFNSMLYDEMYDVIEAANLPIYDEDYVLMVRDFGFLGRDGDKYFYNLTFNLIPIDTFNSFGSNFNWYTTNLGFTTVSGKSTYYFNLHYDFYHYTTPTIHDVTIVSNVNTLFGSTPSYLQNDQVYFCAFCPAWFNKNFFDNNNNIVLYYEPFTPPLDVGVAIIPPNAIIPDYPIGTTPPTQVPPVYTFTDYNWTTPPTFDGSTVENAIGSLQNLVGWLANNLKEEFKNLTSNLKGFFEYLGKTIQYYGNSILQTLNNFIQNFYDNMKSLLEPIFQTLQDLKDKFVDFSDLFIHPFDEEEFEEQIENCQLISQYDELLDNCDIIREVFATAQERDSFIIYIDFENPFADNEHKIIHGEISFNWLVPLRSIYRPFLTVFVLFECFVGGFRLLGGIIGGKAK